MCKYWRIEGQSLGPHSEGAVRTYNGVWVQSPQRGPGAERLGQGVRELITFCICTTQGVGQFVLKSVLQNKKSSDVCRAWPPGTLGSSSVCKELQV